jgi:hypothetical protein
MYKPWVYGIVSIVPGLGHYLIGDRRKAFRYFCLTILAGVISYFLSRHGPSEFLREFSWGVLYIAWSIQFLDVLNRAWLMDKRVNNPGLSSPDIEPISSGKKVFAKETNKDRMFSKIRRQISPEENILAAIDVNLPSLEEKSWGRVEHLFHPCYIAVTDLHLLIMEHDFDGNIMTMERVARDRVVDVSYESGLLSDTLYIYVDQMGDLIIKISRLFRQETQNLYKVFQENM